MGHHYYEAIGDVSLLAWALSALAIIVIGSLWYSPLLFGKSWARHSNIRASDLPKSELRRNYVLALISAGFHAYLLGLIAMHGGNMHSLLFGVGFIWVFVMLEQFNGFIWERAPIALVLIHAFRSLVALCAGILVYFFIG
jgi:hypothetical protein